MMTSDRDTCMFRVGLDLKITGLLGDYGVPTEACYTCQGQPDYHCPYYFSYGDSDRNRLRKNGDDIDAGDIY